MIEDWTDRAFNELCNDIAVEALLHNDENHWRDRYVDACAAHAAQEAATIHRWRCKLGAWRVFAFALFAVAAVEAFVIGRLMR